MRRRRWDRYDGCTLLLCEQRLLVLLPLVLLGTALRASVLFADTHYPLYLTLTVNSARESQQNKQCISRPTRLPLQLRPRVRRGPRSIRKQFNVLHRQRPDEREDLCVLGGFRGRGVSLRDARCDALRDDGELWNAHPFKSSQSARELERRKDRVDETHAEERETDTALPPPLSPHRLLLRIDIDVAHRADFRGGLVAAHGGDEVETHVGAPGGEES